MLSFHFQRSLCALFGWSLVLTLSLLGCRQLSFNIRKDDRSEVLALNREGIEAFERRQYDEAESKFLKAANQDKNDLTSRRYYAETLWLNGKRDASLQLLMELSKSQGASDDILAVNRSAAEKLLVSDQPISALNYAEKVIRIAPKNADGWALRGDINRQLGKYDEAMDDYHRALHFAPDHQETLKDLATLENLTGRYESALATWQRLGRTYIGTEDPTDVICGKALACRYLKRYDESIRYYEKAIEQSPYEGEIYPLLAQVYVDQGDLVSAVEIAHRGNAIFPTDPSLQELTAQLERLRVAKNSDERPY